MADKELTQKAFEEAMDVTARPQPTTADKEERLLGHILAGLRLLQGAVAGGYLRPEIAEIARSGDDYPLASVEQIGAWCEELNVRPLRINGYTADEWMAIRFGIKWLAEQPQQKLLPSDELYTLTEKLQRDQPGGLDYRECPPPWAKW